VQFIKTLTDDDPASVGYHEKEQIALSTHGHSVVFIDTPGFEDAREGITDADVRKKPAAFLDTECVEAIQ
jgi:predicted GTPase